MILDNFIVLEGIDGSGTSTQSKLLKEFLTLNNISFFSTCEPTASPIGKMLRTLLKGDEKVTEETLALLFTADRHEHLYGMGGIIEALEAKKLVISDRYHFSTLAYQSIKSEINLLYNYNKDFPLPSLVFFIDTPPNVADKRVTARAEDREIYEKLSIQEQVRENYFKAFELFKKDGMEVVILDGNEPIETLFNKIKDKILSR